MKRLARHLAALLGRAPPEPEPERQPAAGFDWSLQPDAVEASHLLAQQGRIEEAERRLLDAHALVPANRRVLTQLAELAELRQDWSQALAWWDRINVGREELWQIELPKARLLARRGDGVRARRMLLQVLDANEGNMAVLFFAVPAIVALGPADREGMAEQIGAALERLVRLHGESSDTLATRAGLAELRDDYLQSYRYRREALMLRPRDGTLRALALQAAKRIGRTEQDLDRDCLPTG